MVSPAAASTGTALSAQKHVVVGVADVSAPLKAVRLNGVLKESSTQLQGAGGFGAHAMYLGRRGGTSLPFKGRLYGLVIRGAATPDPTISRVERYLNAKSRAY